MFGPELEARCLRENHPLRLQYAHFSQVAHCKLRISFRNAQFSWLATYLQSRNKQ